MSEKTVKYLINYPHAIITFISYHRNRSLFLCLVVHSENTTEYIFQAVSCCFSVLFLGKCVTSLCSFSCQWLQCLNDSHSRHGKDYRSCSLPVHMWSDATVRAKTQGCNKSKEKGTHGMIFFPGCPVVSIWQWSGVKRISFILRILTGCNRIW